MRWLTRSIATINAILKLLDIYIYIYVRTYVDHVKNICQYFM